MTVTAVSHYKQSKSERVSYEAQLSVSYDCEVGGKQLFSRANLSCGHQCNSTHQQGPEKQSLLMTSARTRETINGQSATNNNGYTAGPNSPV